MRENGGSGQRRDPAYPWLVLVWLAMVVVAALLPGLNRLLAHFAR